MDDDQLLRTQSRHDPGRWHVGDRHTHRDATRGLEITYLVTRITVVGNEEHVFGVETVPGREEHEPDALEG